MSEQGKITHVTKYRRPWWKLSRNWWPLIVFIVVAGVAVFLYNQGGQYRLMFGTANRVIESVSPLETARVRELAVELGDRVKAGDIIAQLETAIIDAEGAVLRQQIEQSSLETRLEQLTLERQFASSLQEAEQALREADMEYKLSKVEHAALVEEIKRMEPLFNQQLIQAELFVTKKAREEVLGESLKLMSPNLKALKAEVTRAEVQKASAMARLREMNEAVSAEKANETINLLEARRDRYTLRARHDGVVSRIDHQAGDVVQTGVPIVSILVDGPIRIVGFLSESNISPIAIGARANIYPTVSMDKVGVISARVAQISPAVYSLPGRASPIRGQAVRGRRIIFDLEEQVALVPGETVSIEIEGSRFSSALIEN